MKAYDRLVVNKNADTKPDIVPTPQFRSTTDLKGAIEEEKKEKKEL
jgi:hypothetical protein